MMTFMQFSILYQYKSVAMTQISAFSLIASRPLPPLARVAFSLTVMVLAWEERRHSRRALRRLDAHLLRDIGLSENDAFIEAKKPYWKA